METRHIYISLFNILILFDKHINPQNNEQKHTTKKEKTNGGYKHNKYIGFAWYIKLDVSYATTYIFRSDGYKI